MLNFSTQVFFSGSRLFSNTKGILSSLSEVSVGNFLGLFPVNTGNVMFLLQDFLPELLDVLQYDSRELKETLGLDIPLYALLEATDALGLDIGSGVRGP